MEREYRFLGRPDTHAPDEIAILAWSYDEACYIVADMLDIPAADIALYMEYDEDCNN